MVDKAKEFTIRSLRDIYNLPTTEQIQRCLRELAETMVTSRRIEKVLTGDIKLYNWPDEFVWKDDDGSETTIKFPSPFPNAKSLTVGIDHRKQRRRL